MNHLILVGRIVKIENEIEKENPHKLVVSLAIPRSYKNQDGVYETDLIKCVLWKGIAERTLEYCKEGDVVSLRGRLQTNQTQIEVIGETISFVAPMKQKDTERDER